ncbi:MAG: hypothetical protein ACPGWR_14690, partial [Ardenticatenaceae bacterium]
CSTEDEQAGMRVLPKMNKQGCVFYRSHEEILHCVQEGCLFYQSPNCLLPTRATARDCPYLLPLR